MSSNARDTAQRAPVDAWLRGVWQRTYYRDAEGREDRETVVYWVQTHSLFADVRVPMEVSHIAARASLHDYSQEEVHTLATLRGFAGHLEQRADICRWQRPIDFQPPSGEEDVGRMQLEGEQLWEYGVGSEYTETYRRVADGSQRMAAFSLVDAADARSGVLLIVDDWVMRAIGRTRPLPLAPSMQALMSNRPEWSRDLDALFDCEVSLGKLSDNVVRWSTQHWRLGRPLLSGRYGVKRECLQEQGDERSALWRLDRSDRQSVAQLAALFSEVCG